MKTKRCAKSGRVLLIALFVFLLLIMGMVILRPVQAAQTTKDLTLGSVVVSDGEDVVITQSLPLVATANKITVNPNAKNVKITLKGVNMNLTNILSNNNISAITIGSGANVTLILDKDSTNSINRTGINLDSDQSQGIAVNGGTLTITNNGGSEQDGILNLNNSIEIKGSFANGHINLTSGGVLNIKAGTVNAYGGRKSAGVSASGRSNGTAGVLNVSGGRLNAFGKKEGVAIGVIRGSSVRMGINVSGGVLNADAKNGSADGAIECLDEGSAIDMVISDGRTMTSVRGTEDYDIGLGTGSLKITGGSLLSSTANFSKNPTKDGITRVYPLNITVGDTELLSKNNSDNYSLTIGGQSYGSKITYSKVDFKGKICTYTTPTNVGQTVSIQAKNTLDGTAYFKDNCTLTLNSGKSGFNESPIQIKKNLIPPTLVSFTGTEVVLGATPGQSYQCLKDGIVVKTLTAGSLDTTVHFTGLTANTLYSFRAAGGATDDSYGGVSTEIKVTPFAYGGKNLISGLYGTAYKNSDGSPISIGVSGAASAYTYALAEGTVLPDGLTLNADGTITGAPTKVGTDLSFKIKATPKNAVDAGNAITAQFKLNVDVSTPGIPTVPAVLGITKDTITLSPVAPVAGTLEALLNIPVEYGVKVGADWRWQSGTQFVGLSQGTTYQFSVRFAALPGKTLPSLPCAPVSLTTLINIVPPTIDNIAGHASPGCGISVQLANGTAIVPGVTALSVGTDIQFVIKPCANHTLSKVILAGSEHISDWQDNDGICILGYKLKLGDTNLKCEATVREKKVTNLEVANPGDITIYANDPANTSLNDLTAQKINPVILKATYDNHTTKTGTAADLGTSWATTGSFNSKGAEYNYTATLNAKSAAQKLKVNTVTATVTMQKMVVKTVNTQDGYPTPTAIGLPATANLSYPPEAGAINESDRTRNITWGNIPADFGKTATTKTFNGTLSVPSWATCNTAVSTNVAIVDKVILKPTFTISNKIYDGNRTAQIIGDIDIDKALIDPAFSDVRLVGTPTATFKTADVGSNIIVTIAGLSLEGNNKDHYQLDLTGIKANITPATVNMKEVTMSGKTEVYDGSVHKIEVGGTLPIPDMGVTYTYQKDSQTVASAVDAGTYIVTANFTTSGNYGPIDPKSATLTITQAAVDMSGVFLNNSTLIYDGQPKAIAISGSLPTGVTGVSYTYYKDGQLITGQPTETGTYTVKADFTVDLNHQAVPQLSAELIIKKIDIDMSGVSFGAVTTLYDAQPEVMRISGTLPDGVTGVTYTYTKDGTVIAGPPTDAGTYGVTASFSVGTSYNPVPDMNTTLTILNRDINTDGISFNNSRVNYDGGAHKLEVSGTLPEGIDSVNYSYQNNDGSPVTTDPPQNAGIYTVTASFNTKPNYNKPADKTAMLVINKIDVNLSGVSLSDKTVPYNGLAQRLNIDGVLPEGVTEVSYTYLSTTDPNAQTTAPSQIGTYMVTASFTTDGNHNPVPPLTARLTITKANIELGGIKFEKNDVDYDGNAHALSITGNTPQGVNNIIYVYQKNGEGPLTTEAPKEAGNYLVMAVFEVDANYNTPLPLTVHLVIKKKTVDTSGVIFSGQAYTYDGTAKSLSVDTSTLPEGVTAVKYTYLKEGDNTATDTPPTITGNYTVTANFSVDGNHQDAPAKTAVLTINKADITGGTGFVNDTVTYDGNPHKIEYTTLPQGATDAVYTYQKIGSNDQSKTPPTQVGDYVVLATLTVDSNHNPAPTMLARLTIGKAKIDMSGVSFDDKTIEFGGDPTMTITGTLPNGVTVGYVYYQNGTITGTPTAPGTYTVVANFTAGQNYEAIQSMTASLAITEENKQTVDTKGFSISAGPFIYDSTPKSPTHSALPTGVTKITYTYFDAQGKLLPDAPTNAGTYTVVASFTTEANYNPVPSQSVQMIINKATIDTTGIGLNDIVAEHDGQTHPVQITGALDNKATVSYVYLKDSETTFKTDAPLAVGDYKGLAVFTVSDPDNYEAIPAKTARVIITASTINPAGIVFDNKTVAYNEQPQSIVPSGVPDTIASTSVTYLKDGDTKATAQPPTDAGGYTAQAVFTAKDGYIAPAPKTARLVITPKAIDMTGLSLGDKTVEYNGQPVVVGVTGNKPEGVQDIIISYQKNNPDGSVTEWTQTPPTDTGAYTVKAEFTTTNNNYSPVQPLLSKLFIKKGIIGTENIAFYDKSFVYDGSPKAISVSGDMPTGITGVTYRYLADGETTATNQPPTLPGKYTVKASFTTNPNYNPVSDMLAALTITKVDINLSQTTLTDKNVTYDGAPKTIELSSLPTGAESVRYVYQDKATGNLLSTAPANAGTYLVVAIITPAPGYNTPAVLTATLTIDKVSITDTSGIQFDNQTFTYDGQPKGITVGGTLPQGIVNVSYTYQKEGTAIPNSDQPSAVGNYLVTAHFNTDINHNPVPDRVAIMTIKKLDIDISGLKLVDKGVNYNGQPQGLTLEGNLPQGITKANITYWRDGDPAGSPTVPTNPGTYQVTVNFEVGISYNTPPALIAHLTILNPNLKNPIMTGVSFNPESVPYDGNLHTVQISGNLPQGVASVYYEYLKADGSVMLTQGVSEIGTYTVRAVFTPEPGYNPAAPMSTTISITKIPIDTSGIKLENKTVTYNGSPQALNVSGNMPKSISMVYYTYQKDGETSSTATVPHEVGRYTVTAWFVTGPNYQEVANIKAVLTIEKATIDMGNTTLSDKTVTYDGTPKAVEISYLPYGAKSVSYSYQNTETGEISQAPPANAGVYTVTAAITPMDGYNTPTALTATLTIQKQNITDLSDLQFTNQTITYDGQPKGITVTGNWPQGIIDIQYTYQQSGSTQPSDTKPTEAGSYLVTAHFVTDPNYNQIPDRVAIMTIKKLDIDTTGLSLKDQTVTYDGTPKGLTLEGTTPEGIIDTIITYRKDGDTEATPMPPTKPGTYHVVASFQVGISYNTPPALTANLTIIDPSLINPDMSGVKLDSKAIAYDGSTHTLAITGNLPKGVAGVTYEYLNADGTLIPAQGVKDIGTYTVRAIFTPEAGYNPAPSMTATLTITKIPVDTSGLKFEDKIVLYDGSPKPVQVQGKLPQGVTMVFYTYQKDGQDHSTTIAPTAVGNYTVTAYFAIAPNYEQPQEKTMKLSIVSGISNVEIETLPTGTTTQGDKAPNLGGGTVKVTYTNGATVILPMDQADSIQGYNPDKPGQQTITLVFGDKQIEVSINVIPKNNGGNGGNNGGGNGQNNGSQQNGTAMGNQFQGSGPSTIKNPVTGQYLTQDQLVSSVLAATGIIVLMLYGLWRFKKASLKK